MINSKKNHNDSHKITCAFYFVSDKALAMHIDELNT